jgi:hypothetical protein
MSLYTRHDLIFGHEGNARAATSVILIGVLAALIGSVFMAIGPRLKQEPRPTPDARRVYRGIGAGSRHRTCAA